MSSDRGERIYQLYLRAKDLPEAEREALLAGEDLPPDVLAELRALLRNTQPQDAGGSPVSQMVNQLKFGLIAPASDDLPAPTVIGPYQILSVLGEGGYGVVYLAERREPMVQRVAIKLIKPGMDSKAVIARFEQERQALAVMEHPGVARVLDGGTTPDGRPYFVMEYVKGEPINTYCDSRRLPIKARLDLFITVCEAVQHAHHKGIIHRDLKPSNILVTEVEGHAVPKVIDFGVAKAVSHTLTEKTIFTQHGGLIGTPEYMSPEQANIGAIDIDTRTDVYSLGVVLYELVTGLLPFDPHELRSKGYQEIQRIIREVDPPRPSTRLSGADDVSGTRIALARAAERERLASDLRRELEWIPLKAMRKERERRYRSPADLAADVHNYLDGRAVEAAPDSRAYLMRKFVRRNRGAVAAGGAVVASLAIGLASTMVEARRADDRAAAELRARTRAEAINAFMTKTLGSGDPNNVGGSQQTTIVEAMHGAIADLESGRFGSDPEAEAEITNTIAVILDNNGDARGAEPLYERVLEKSRSLHKSDHPDLATALNNLAYVRKALGRASEAKVLYIEALEMQRRLFPDDHASVALALNNLADVQQTLGQAEDAEQLFRQSLEMRLRLFKGDHFDVATSLHNLGFLLNQLGRADEGSRLLEQALEMFQRLRTGDNPAVARTLDNLASAKQALGHTSEAESIYTQSLEMRRRVYKGDHPDVAVSLNNLAGLKMQSGEAAEAESLLQQSLEMRLRLFKGDHEDVAVSLGNLGFLRLNLGSPAEAEPLLTRSLEMLERIYTADHPLVAQSLVNVARAKRASGNAGDAEPLFERALAMNRRLYKDDHPAVASSMNALAGVRQALGRLAEAEPLYAESMEMYKRLYKGDHSDVANSVSNLASIRTAMGRLDDAEPLFAESLAMRRRLYPNGHPFLAMSLQNLARVRLKLGRAAEAVPLAEEAVELASRILPANSPDIQRYRDTLLDCQRALSDNGEPSPVR